jgi:hypothetical protein
VQLTNAQISDIVTRAFAGAGVDGANLPPADLQKLIGLRCQFTKSPIGNAPMEDGHAVWAASPTGAQKASVA